MSKAKMGVTLGGAICGVILGSLLFVLAIAGIATGTIEYLDYRYEGYIAVIALYSFILPLSIALIVITAILCSSGKRLSKGLAITAIVLLGLIFWLQVGVLGAGGMI